MWKQKRELLLYIITNLEFKAIFLIQSNFFKIIEQEATKQYNFMISRLLNIVHISIKDKELKKSITARK